MTGAPIITFKPQTYVWPSMSDDGRLAVTTDEFQNRVVLWNTGANGEVGAVELPSSGIHQPTMLATGGGAARASAPSITSSDR